MPCEILIHRNKNNYSHIDSVKDKQGVYKKGYIVIARDVPHSGWGNEEKFSAGNFVTVLISNATADELNSYIDSWKLEIDYILIGSDLTIDGHRYKIFSTNPGTSGLANITKTKAEKYLNNWNVDVFSFDVNEVVFDIKIFDMVKSKGYLDEEELVGLNAIEQSYNQITGEHIIEVDWSNYRSEVANRNSIASSIQNKIIRRNGTIISYNLNNQTGIFSIFRNDVLKWFKSDVKQKIIDSNVLYRRQYYIPEVDVDSLVQYSNNNSEPYELTKAQLSTYVNSFLDKVDA